MLTTVLIAGVEYHAYEDDGRLVLDERNQPIPATVCLCAAREPNECCCGAWDRPYSFESASDAVASPDER